LIASTVVQLAGFGRLVVGELLGFFNGAGAFEGDSDAGGSKGVASDLLRQAADFGPPLDPIEGVTDVQVAEREALFQNKFSTLTYY
jgi:hypothetical protein